MADVPKPITIKPITIKPVQAPAVSTPAEAPATTATAPVAPAKAPASAPAIPGIKPIVIQSPAGGTPLPATGTSSTIRLKPVTPPPAPATAATPSKTAKIPAPGITTDLSAAMKGKTSRISLEAVLATPPTTTKSPVPPLTPGTAPRIGSALGQEQNQTLRLKRPAATAALHKVAEDLNGNTQADAATATTATQVPNPTKISTIPTTRSEAVKPLETDASEAPTIKRKSLVLKKPGAKPTLKTAASKPDAETPATDAAAPLSDAPAAAAPAKPAPIALGTPEKTNVIFPIIAAAAIVLLIALIMLFMSEACGPDRTGTQFSSFRSLPSVDWPGKVQVY
ncbi:MAG: hypothetical protein ACI4QT_09155 [Kiritimatiellia bacterium]